MQRLEGMDASFVYLETPAAPMQVAMTCVFDPSTAPDGYSFAKVRELVENRLHLVPPFRRRLVGMPGLLHRPGWIEDPDFNLDLHLRRVRLPAPGGIGELEQFTTKVRSRPLAPSRPPWEMHVVEGLADGMVGAVTKMHHAAIDGVSGAELTANRVDLEPDPPAVAAPRRSWTPEPPPSRLALARGAAREMLRQPVVAGSVLARTARAALRLLRHNRQPETTPPPGPFSAPRTCCNGPLTERRHVAFTQIGLDDVQRIKDAAGVTVNDVVLAVCAGALRGHLDDHGQLPDRPLVAAVPVSVRTENEQATMGNQLTAMLVELATTIENPMSRLQAPAASTRAAKAQNSVLGPETIPQLAGLTPPALLAAMGALDSRFHVLGRIPPACNLIVSNFTGPPFPLYCAGAHMVAAYPMGPLGIGTALNVTVQSYLDTLWFGIVTCPDVVLAPWTLTDRIPNALRDLTKTHTDAEPEIAYTPSSP